MNGPAGPMELQAALHRLLGHPRRLKLALVLRHAFSEGRTVFPTKMAMVREYGAFWDEGAALESLDYDIRRFVRAGVLSVVARRPAHPPGVMLKIEIPRLLALPLPDAEGAWPAPLLARQPARIVNSRDAASAVRPMVTDWRKEHVFALCLDNQGRLGAARLVSVGTVDAALVHPREVFRPALLCSAVAVVLAHTHPGGDLAPSREDVDLTSRLRLAGEHLGVPLIDHVVLNEQGECRSLVLEAAPRPRRGVENRQAS